jgi:hypothetical protein
MRGTPYSFTPQALTAGTIDVGTLNVNLYVGPATAPTGSCTTAGWVFSQDGHATFCNGSIWITKI